MHKRTDELKPGDVIYIHGERATVEMVAEEIRGIYLVRHSLGGGWFKAGGQWLIEEPLDDVVRMAEKIARGGG